MIFFHSSQKKRISARISENLVGIDQTVGGIGNGLRLNFRG